MTKCTIDRRDKNLAQASTIAVVLERQHTALGEIVQVFWPFACFGHFSLLAFFAFWPLQSLLTDELWRGLLLEPLLVAGS